MSTSYHCIAPMSVMMMMMMMTMMVMIMVVVEGGVRWREGGDERNTLDTFSGLHSFTILDMKWNESNSKTNMTIV